MDIDAIAARAAELGADIRCVTHMMPGDGRDGGTTGKCAVLVETEGSVLSLMRAGFRAEGMSPRRAKVDDTRPGGARLDAFLGAIAGLQARERAVAPYGTDTLVYPPWAFSVDALALEIAAADGLDLEPCSRPATHSRTFTLHFGRLSTADEAWRWSRVMHAVRGGSGDAPPGSGRSVEAEMKGSRLNFRVLSPRTRKMTLREEPGGTWLLLWGVQIPDTVLTGLKGRRLADVVEGIGADHEILRAESRDGLPWLKVRGPRVPLAPAPDGVDTDWMKL